MTKNKNYVERKPKQSEEDDEEILWGCWGIEKKRDDQSFVFEEGKTYDLTILEIKETEKNYRYIYKTQVKGADKPVLLVGNTTLNNSFGFGKWDVEAIEEGDKVQVTYQGKYKSKKTGFSGYKIKVGVLE